MSGAGATFPAPIYEEWLKQFPKTIEGVLSSLLQYLAGPGQSAASRLNYTPIPRGLRESVAAKLRLLHDPDGRLLGT